MYYRDETTGETEWIRAGKVSISSFVGKVFDKVVVRDDEIDFHEGGDVYRMFHDQDCCESVSIEDFNGDAEDLVGVPIMLAEESTSDVDPTDEGRDKDKYDSNTWTFYRFRTIKGTVSIRWYGTSNGYYSESVDIVKLPNRPIYID